MELPNTSPRRRFNDDRMRLFGATGRLIAFVCECPDPECRNTVLLTMDEYESRARTGPVLHEAHDSDSA